MPTQSARLDLAKPVAADDFDTDEIAANWQKVDDHPGIRICTLATRPTWGSAHEGMHIYETDTDLYYRWNGAAWERTFPRGRLATPATRTTDLTDATGSFVNIAQLSAVAVPAGNLSVFVSVGWYDVSGDVAEIEVRRDSTPILTIKAAVGVGGYTQILDLPGSGGGTYDYTARFRTLAASSTLECDTGGKAFRLSVIEV